MNGTQQGDYNPNHPEEGTVLALHEFLDLRNLWAFPTYYEKGCRLAIPVIG